MKANTINGIIVNEIEKEIEKKIREINYYQERKREIEKEIKDMRAILSKLKDSSHIQITLCNISEAKSKEQLKRKLTPKYSRLKKK